MAEIVVVGASRGIGLETVRAALAAGHRVRAFARSANTIPISDERLVKIVGSALDKASVAQGVTGADGVIQTLGVAAGKELITGTRLFSESTRVLVDAMSAAGVKRLVAVTGIGAGDSRGRGGLLYDALLFPVFLKRIYDDKDVQERIIRSSGLDWTIARPGILVDSPVRGSVRALTDPATWRASPVARADVAQFLVREVVERKFLRETPLLIA